MGLGIVLIVVGAILDWAVTVTTSGFNINTVGLILLIAGVVSLIIGAAMFFMGSNRHAVTREAVNYTPGGGRERIVEQRDMGSTF